MRSATGATTVTLDGAQTVGLLEFSSSAGYKLASGNSGSLTLDDTGGTIGGQIIVLGGSDSISAPLVIANSGALVTLGSGCRLAISGAVTETGGRQPLVLAGKGTLVLGGSNDYTGGTYVTGGALIATSPSFVPNGSSLTVGNGGAFEFAAPAFSSAPVYSNSRSSEVAAVPEPLTLGLAASAVIGLIASTCRRQRRAEAQSETIGAAGNS